MALSPEAHNRPMTVRAWLGVLLLGALGVLGGLGMAWPAMAQSDGPLSGVVVLVERVEDKAVVGKSITGNDGTVRFHLPSGVYRIVAVNAIEALRLDALRRGVVPVQTDRTSGITVLVIAYGSVRERRLVVAQLTDGMETVQIETAVTSPIRVVVQRNEQ